MSSSTQPPHVVDFTIRVIEFRSNSLKALKNNEEKFISNFINPQIALPITSTDISFWGDPYIQGVSKPVTSL